MSCLRGEGSVGEGRLLLCDIFGNSAVRRMYVFHSIQCLYHSSECSVAKMYERGDGASPHVRESAGARSLLVARAHAHIPFGMLLRPTDNKHSDSQQFERR